jgi:hypothetical protein
MCACACVRVCVSVPKPLATMTRTSAICELLILKDLALLQHRLRISESLCIRESRASASASTGRHVRGGIQERGVQINMLKKTDPPHLARTLALLKALSVSELA